MSEIVDRLEEPLTSVISSVWYRTLGISSIHTSIDEIKKFVEAPDNPFGGKLKKKWGGIAYEVWEWDHINISGQDAEDPITFASWIFGNGRNTVFMRYRFWDLHLFRAPIEKTLGIEEISLNQIIPPAKQRELREKVKSEEVK